MRSARLAPPLFGAAARFAAGVAAGEALRGNPRPRGTEVPSTRSSHCRCRRRARPVP